MQRLRASQRRRQRLDGGADDVVLRLLGGERAARRLGVEPHLGRLGARPDPLPHQPGPEPPRRPELGHLLEEVVVRIPKEGETGSEVIHLEPGVDRRPDVGEAVGQGEGHLLHRGGPRLPDVVPADRDRVPRGQPGGAVGEQVSDQPHRLPRRVDVGAPRHVLLEDVVLHRAPDGGGSHPLLFGHRLVEQQEDGGGGVDRHRGADLAQAGYRRAGGACRRGCRWPHQPCPPPPLPWGDRSRTPSGWGGRRRPRARAGRRRGVQ